VREHWWGPGWFWLVGLGQLLFWVAVVALVATVIRSRPREIPRTGGSNALAILDERYASGEIDRDEFLERRTVLIEQSRQN
jgi:putative membrane protein